MRRKDRKPEKVFFVALVNVSFMCVAEVTTPELLFWCELRTLQPNYSPEREIQTETHITAMYCILRKMLLPGCCYAVVVLSCPKESAFKSQYCDQFSCQIYGR